MSLKSPHRFDLIKSMDTSNLVEDEDILKPLEYIHFFGKLLQLTFSFIYREISYDSIIESITIIHSFTFTNNLFIWNIGKLDNNKYNKTGFYV